MIRIGLLLCMTTGLLVLPAMMVNAMDTRHPYYLYEEGQLPFTKCLRHEGLESHAPITFTSVAKGCKVFHFRSDGTIQATTSTTDPKPSEWCVAASGRGNDGDLIQLFLCNGQANQVWQLTDGRLRGIHDKCIVQGTGDTAMLGSCQHAITWHTQMWVQD